MSWFGMMQAGMQYWGASTRLLFGDTTAMRDMAQAGQQWLGEATDAYGSTIAAGVDTFADAAGLPLAKGGVDEGHPFSSQVFGAKALPPKGQPVTLPMEQIVQPLYVDAAALRALIPAQLQIEQLVGKTAVLLSATRFDLGPALNIDKAYNEISYAVPVSYRGQRGLFFLKLHLNWQEGVQMGIERYGYPKELRTVSYVADPRPGAPLSMQAVDPRGRPLFGISGREALGLGTAAFTGLASAAMRESEELFKVCFFDRNGALVRSVTPTVSTSVRPFIVDSLDTPYLQQLGVRGVAGPAVLRKGAVQLTEQVDVLEQIR